MFHHWNINNVSDMSHMYCSTEALNYNTTYVASVYHVQTLIIALFKDVNITL